MILTFKNIHIENFLSFGTADLLLDRGNYVLVKGENENPVDNAESNGSGKSAIFDAIVWALTGTTTRECKNVSNINSDNGAKVTLYFNVDDCEYEVTRTKDYKPLGSTLKIIRNGEDVSGKGIRDSEKLLSEYLPDLTSSFLGSVIILGQGLPQRFSNNTPSGRKDVLEKLSKSDFMIDDLKQKVSDRKTQIQKLIRENEDKLLAATTSKSRMLKQKESIDRYLQELPDKHELQEKIDTYNRKVEELVQEVEGKKQRLESESITELSKEKECKLLQLSSLNSSMYSELEQKKSEYSDQINELSERKQSLKSYIRTNENIRDVCPTCGQKLIGVEKPNVDKERQELGEVETSLFDISAKRDSELNVIKDSYMKKSKELDNEIQQLGNQILEKSKAQSELKRSIEDLQKSIEQCKYRVASLVGQMDALEENAVRYNQELTSICDQLNEIEKEILYYTNEQGPLNRRSEIISKMNTILSRDFRGYLLTNVINYISDRAKFYSMQVFGNDNIGFQLAGNAIEISFDNKEYSNLSGGEKQRVDLIIQLSIRDMLCKFMGFSSNIIVLDEFIDGLDAKGCEQILGLIANNLTDVGTVYIITHHSSVAIPTDDEIIVVKDSNKISRIR